MCQWAVTRAGGQASGTRALNLIIPGQQIRASIDAFLEGRAAMSVSPTLPHSGDALCQTLSLQPVTDAGLGLRDALERCAAAAGVRYESVSATLELLELEVLGISPGPAPSKKPGPAPSKKRGRDESPPRQEPRAEPKGRGGSALLAFALKSIEEAATLYAALGVDEAADAATIKKRYRELALTVHPDKGGSASAFKILNEAKSTLCDADSRAAYDRSLGGGKC